MKKIIIVGLMFVLLVSMVISSSASDKIIIKDDNGNMQIVSINYLVKQEKQIETSKAEELYRETDAVKKCNLRQDITNQRRKIGALIFSQKELKESFLIDFKCSTNPKLFCTEKGICCNPSEKYCKCQAPFNNCKSSTCKATDNNCFCKEGKCWTITDRAVSINPVEGGKL